MAWGKRKNRFRGRRRPRWKLWAVLVVVLALVGLGLFSYRAGTELAQREVQRLEKEVTRLSAEVEKLEAVNAEAVKWQRRYEEDVPTGAAKTLVSEIQTLLANGVAAERIDTLLTALGEPQECEAAPQSKRFFVRTPVSEGVDDTVTFADNAITLTAEGRSATNGAGNPQAWFDPAEPVTVRFTELGGRETEATARLPMHRSIVRGDTEYRFSIVNDAKRGYVRATVERCPLP